MYLQWPPRLLIADEVGLGKTIQAGLLLRQAWLSGRAHRILIMAPKSVLRQWQIELREKFNLNWPIYDGKQLTWAPSPALGANTVKKVGKHEWHEHAPCVITSSHLMRRKDRAEDLLNDAQPWDLVIVDEAHHARRRAGGTGNDERPNQLLRLLRRLKSQTDGLVMLTATPMQVSPVEVWDLLDLLGLPREWNLEAFQQYFDAVSKTNPSEHEMAFMARMFRAVETHWGPADLEEARQAANVKSNIKFKRILKALREESTIPLKRLETDERKAAQRVLKLNTPVRRLISRHTRNLLKRYYEAGKISTPIADRSVDDAFVALTQTERKVYERVEEYITSTYNNASKERRTAIGFVMTIYRRRLASSFYALQRTLEMRLSALTETAGDLFDSADIEEDLPDDEVSSEVSDSDQAVQYERDALKIEEKGDLEALLEAVKQLPADTKANRLQDAIAQLRNEGYRQVMVFTQFTDTMDFLRDFLAKDSDLRVMCYSGRGGEVLRSGGWDRITRDDIKARFRKRDAEVLVCTDAAAEGLNFQFCGAIVNYDMPWNPMRVEQRIGRIDRVGQKYGTIRVINLHYENTVETDIYLALRGRLNLFETFVGRLQPILSKLPKAIEGVALSQTDDRKRDTDEVVEGLRNEVAEAEESGFDLDQITEGSIEEKPRPDPPYELQDLAKVLQRTDVMPQGDQVEVLGSKDRGLLRPGMTKSVRVTTDPMHFEEHADSVELWSPGSPVFPNPEDIGGGSETPSKTEFRKTLGW
jgi:SNF2 family DNA or RNA helicase